MTRTLPSPFLPFSNFMLPSAVAFSLEAGESRSALSFPLFLTLSPQAAAPPCPSGDWLFSCSSPSGVVRWGGCSLGGRITVWLCNLLAPRISFSREVGNTNSHNYVLF